MKSTLINEFETYLSQRRRQLQDWEAYPPHKAGWLIFCLVCLELVLTRRLIMGENLSGPFISQIFGTAIIIGGLVAFLTKVTAEIGGYFNKIGNWKATYTFLNIGLYPMLFYLPASLTLWAAGDQGLIRILVFLYLSIKVLSNWREATEVTFEFNRWQSALILYMVLGFLMALVVMFMYLSFFRTLSGLTNLFAV